MLDLHDLMFVFGKAICFVSVAQDSGRVGRGNMPPVGKTPPHQFCVGLLLAENVDYVCKTITCTLFVEMALVLFMLLKFLEG